MKSEKFVRIFAQFAFKLTRIILLIRNQVDSVSLPGETLKHIAKHNNREQKHKILYDKSLA